LEFQVQDTDRETTCLVRHCTWCEFLR